MDAGDLPLKILHIVEHGISQNSGYGFRSVNIFRAQRERGWQPVVLTFPKPNESGKGDWKQPEIAEGMRRYYRPLPSSHGRFSFLARRRHRSALAQRIHEIAVLEKPDVLHAHSPVFNGVAALEVGLKLGIPVVYEIRSLWEEAAAAHGTYGYHSRRFNRLRALETWVCRNVDRVVAISSNLKNHLIDRGIPPDKISVVSNGVDLDNIRPAARDAEYQEKWKLSGKKIVGYVGSFRSYEGLDLLIKAIARLSKIRPDVVLLLVGGGRAEVESELKALVDKLDLHDRVILPGRIPQERIPGVYALIDILAYPRRRIPLTEVVTPLKPLEAMAMGKAFIASDVGGHRELIQPGDNGLLFPAGNESALTDAISDLLDNQVLRQRLATQGESWVRRERSWSKTTAAYCEAYKKARQYKIGPKSIENMSNGKRFSGDLAIVCNTTRWGGLSRVVSTLCNAWSRQGRKVYLITLKDDDNFFYLEPAIRRIAAGTLNTTGTIWTMRRRILSHSAKTLAVLKRFSPSRLSNKIALLEASPWILPRVGPLRAAIQQTDTSVVISFGSVANILTILACRNLVRKIIISERNDVGRRPLLHPWEQLRFRLYSRADVVTTNTMSALSAMQAYVNNEKLAFVPNPIVRHETPADIEQESSFRTPFILIVGNLNRLKAHDVLLDAFARLSSDLSDWRLAIVGDGKLEKPLRARADVLGIGNRVDWYGLVPDPFVFYRAASIFVLTSRSEGMPNALMEAMSCGLSVIVSNASPGLLDLVEDGKTGLVVPTAEPAPLAKAIELLANNPSLRKRLGDAARQRVSEYELSKVMQIWEPIILAGSETRPGTLRVPDRHAARISSPRTAGTNGLTS